jgi:hypothetical protein
MTRKIQVVQPACSHPTHSATCLFPCFILLSVTPLMAAEMTIPDAMIRMLPTFLVCFVLRKSPVQISTRRPVSGTEVSVVFLSHFRKIPGRLKSNHGCFDTYRTKSMQQSPSREADGTHLAKKLPSFYGTRMFISVFTTARHRSLSCGR